MILLNREIGSTIQSNIIHSFQCPLLFTWCCFALVVTICFQGNHPKIVDKDKVARYTFSGSIPPKFEHKLRRDKQRFGKIATTVVLGKDENCYYQGCNDIGVVIANK